jgi:putative alpha-1,2-mannosidase
MSNGSEVKYDSYKTYRFRSRNEAAGTNLQFLAEYKTRPDDVILVKVAVSAVSAANALQNLDAEIPDWGFERVMAETRARWDRELSRIEIEGSQEEKETFYTGMYHAFLAPNLFEDITSEYRGLDSNIHHAKGFHNYAVFSLWDTYRATHPLFALIQARRDADMINSLLARQRNLVHDRLPRRPGYRRRLPQKRQRLRPGARLPGLQGHRHEPRLRWVGRLQKTRLCALR